MLSYNELKPKMYIVMNGEPYEVVSTHVFRKQKRKPVNQTKLKSLVSGKVVEQTLQQSDKLEEAEVDKRDIKYLYENKGEYWFCDPDDPSDRFKVDEAVIGVQSKFLKKNDEIEALVFDNNIIGIKLPIKMEFVVKEAPPNIKGNTAQGGDKLVVLETGATVTTPMFINTGDKIEINTESGEYVGRVS